MYARLFSEVASFEIFPGRLIWRGLLEPRATHLDHREERSGHAADHGGVGINFERDSNQGSEKYPADPLHGLPAQLAPTRNDQAATALQLFWALSFVCQHLSVNDRPPPLADQAGAIVVGIDENNS